MPELPEVETTVRDLKPQLIGRTIVTATIRWKRTIAVPRARAFGRDVCGYTITDITRRAKYLRFHLRKDDTIRYLFVHLRMTGGFRIDPCHAPRDKHMHVLFQLDDGRELRFRDTRKFGRMWFVEDQVLVIGKLGPEPLEIKEKDFVALFTGKRRQLKPLLLDQTFIAGLGNIYVDESLWYARLHPLRSGDSLTRAERVRLYHAIQRVLTRAIAVGGTSIDIMYTRVNGASGGFQDSLRAFDREKRPCRRCGTPILKTTVGQRGTHYCPKCQRIQG